MKRYWNLCFVLLFLAGNLQGREWNVENGTQLAAACARAAPGDTVLMAPGEWRDLEVDLHFNGEADRPVVVRTREAGRTVLTGTVRIRMYGSFGQLQGLSFNGARAAEGADALVDMGTEEISASDLRITQCAFVACNPADPSTRYMWIRLYGRRHRVDHNVFALQDHSGVTVQMKATEDSAEHRIDHNLFRDRAPGTGNGFEMIQLGQSKDSMKRGRCRVEDNWFVRCDGEAEIISSKTHQNLIRRNLFLECAGSVTLRHGDDSAVLNNTFQGEGKAATGGVRVIGSGHRVAHNEFAGLTGRTGGVIVLYCGIPDSPLNGYFPADGVTIENNRFQGNSGNGIYLNGGYGNRGRTLIPKNGVIRGNAWLDQGGGSVAIAGQGYGFQYSNNLYAYGVETGVIEPGGMILLEDNASQVTAGPREAHPTAAEVGPGWKPDKALNDGKWRASDSPFNDHLPPGVSARG